ncbi:hypothetical protein JCM5353_006815 [Sporobolomyces roseus]
MLRSTFTRQPLQRFSRSLHSTSFLLSKQDTPLTHPSLVSDPPIAHPSTASDPWPLKPPPLPPAPTLPPHIKTMDDLLEMPHPEGRDNEPTEVLRKRLVYESRKRGILEMDLILSTFAQQRLNSLNDRQLREYDRFLTLPDWTIFYYVTGKAEAPEPWKSSEVLRELLHHSANKQKEVRSMPALETEKQ